MSEQSSKTEKSKRTQQKRVQWLDVAIALLFVVSLVLGWRIYAVTTQEPVADTSQKSAAQKGTGSPATISPQAQQNQGSRAKIDISALPPEERVLWVPNNDEPNEIKATHAQLVSELAVEGTELAVTDCKPDPLVLEITNGQVLTIINDSDTDKVLHLGPEDNITVPANGVLEHETNFPYVPGIYGYGCDDSKMSVGVFMVKE